jgi:hypothetical protein
LTPYTIIPPVGLWHITEFTAETHSVSPVHHRRSGQCACAISLADSMTSQCAYHVIMFDFPVIYPARFQNQGHHRHRHPRRRGHTQYETNPNTRETTMRLVLASAIIMCQNPCHRPRASLAKQSASNADMPGVWCGLQANADMLNDITIR